VAGERIDVQVRTVDADFFAVMSIPIRRGRPLSIADHPNGLHGVIDDRLPDAAGPTPTRSGTALGRWHMADHVGSLARPFTPRLPSVGQRLFVRTGRRAQATPRSSLSRLARAPPWAGHSPEVRPSTQTTGAVPRDHDAGARALMTPFRLIFVLVLLFATIALGLAAVGCTESWRTMCLGGRGNSGFARRSARAGVISGRVANVSD